MSAIDSFGKPPPQIKLNPTRLHVSYESISGVTEQVYLGALFVSKVIHLRYPDLRPLHAILSRLGAPGSSTSLFLWPPHAVEQQHTQWAKNVRDAIFFSIISFAALAVLAMVTPAWANGDDSIAYQSRSFDVVSDAPTGTLSVVVSKSQTIKLPSPFAEALIGDNKIADILPLSDHSIYVLGKTIGSTSLAILDENKQVLQVIQIDVTHDLVSLRSKLREILPTSNIAVSSASGGVMLSGSVPDTIALNKAITIAEKYAPQAITNVIVVGSSQQVMVEVRFLEASRSAARELGIGTSVRNNRIALDTGNQARVIGGEIFSAANLLSGTAPFGTLIARLLDKGTSADIIIKALEQRGLARRLAEPNLITLSGDTASFLAGGEFPFPIDAGNNKISIEFKQFGVALAFTPTVLSNGLINLKIVPEVSELDTTRSVSINNITIPGLVVRRASTTVELRDGQSFAIAGLLQHTHTKNQAQLPWLGQVPVLGALFRSAEYRKNETDLVIIVTPRLVQPKVPGGKLATPLDDKVPSADADFFLLGRAEHDKRRLKHLKHLSSIKGQYGHIIDVGDEEIGNVRTK